MLLAVSDPVSLAEEEASSVLDDVSSAEAVELLSSLALALAADAEEVMDSVLAALLCACEEAAVVEEAAASPAQVAAVGRLLTPWPAQRELANWRVSVGMSAVVHCLITAFLFESGDNLLSWSSLLHALLTQHERPLSSSVLLQMHWTSSELHDPKLSPTQLAAQVGRPGICAEAREVRRVKVRAVRVLACMVAELSRCDF